MREKIRQEIILMAKMFWAAAGLCAGVWAFGKILQVMLT